MLPSPNDVLTVQMSLPVLSSDKINENIIAVQNWLLLLSVLSSITKLDVAPEKARTISRISVPEPRLIHPSCLRKRGFLCALCSGSHPPRAGGTIPPITSLPSPSARLSLLHTEAERQELPQACDSSPATPVSHALTHISERGPPPYLCHSSFSRQAHRPRGPSVQRF